MPDPDPPLTAMTTEFVMVDDDLARKWLETSPPHQRRVSKGTVDGYATAMRTGKWRETAEPIEFDTDGALIQGRHRLMAVVQSGVTIGFLVVREAPVNSFAVIDTGRKRTAGQFLTGSYQHTVVAAARILYAVEKGLTIPQQYKPWGALAIDDQIEYVETWPELTEWVSECDQTSRRSQIGTKFLLAVVAQASRTEHDDHISGFLEGVREGTASDWRVAGDPRHAVREKFLTTNISYNTVVTAQDAGYALVVKAWNAYVLGQQLSRMSLKVRPGSDRRPVVVGSDVNFNNSPVIPTIRRRLPTTMSPLPSGGED
jgi:hypothetical protein